MVDQAIALSGQKRHVLVAVALATVFVSFIYLTQSGRTNIPDHGNYWTDMSQVIGARHFNQYGFVNLRFGLLRDDGIEIGLPAFYFSHWPSFPSVLLGQLYRWGLSTAEARLVPLLVSSTALIAIFLLTRRVLEDWRLGLVASLALAAEAPYRILSDAFGYPSYDFANKTWILLFITLGSLATGRRRVAWLMVAGVGAFITIAFFGFEMVPAIFAYSLLFPLLFATWTASAAERRRVALIAGLCVGLGFVAGMGFHLAHNSWLLGGLQPAIADLWKGFDQGSLRSYDPMSERGYIPYAITDFLSYYIIKLVNRALVDYPFHLIVIGAACLLAGFLKNAHLSDAGARALKWLGVVFFGEVLWFILFRQHTDANPHTMDHLVLTMSLGVAVGALIFWNLFRGSAVGRAGVVLVGLALFAAATANVGYQPRQGILPLEIDWTQQQEQVGALSALVPLNGVVVLDVGNSDPSPEFLLGRTFVRRSPLTTLADSAGRPWYLITQPGSQAYNDLRWGGGLLVKETKEFALFDMNKAP